MGQSLCGRGSKTGTQIGTLVNGTGPKPAVPWWFNIDSHPCECESSSQSSTGRAPGAGPRGFGPQLLPGAGPGARHGGGWVRVASRSSLDSPSVRTNLRFQTVNVIFFGFLKRGYGPCGTQSLSSIAIPFWPHPSKQASKQASKQTSKTYPKPTLNLP